MLLQSLYDKIRMTILKEWQRKRVGTKKKGEMKAMVKEEEDSRGKQRCKGRSSKRSWRQAVGASSEEQGWWLTDLSSAVQLHLHLIQARF